MQSSEPSRVTDTNIIKSITQSGSKAAKAQLLSVNSLKFPGASQRADTLQPKRPKDKRIKTKKK